jgi:hypothetical protein
MGLKSWLKREAHYQNICYYLWSGFSSFNPHGKRNIYLPIARTSAMLQWGSFSYFESVKKKAARIDPYKECYGLAFTKKDWGLIEAHF